MTPSPSNPGDRTPPPLNEEHMLEWIEGRLSRIEEGHRAAGVRPGVQDRVRQMQANRRALQSLPQEHAPPELMDRVLAALEREALLGITNGHDVSDHPPISIAPVMEANRTRNLSRWAPGLALAAGLALLIAGSAYWGSILLKPRHTVGPIATNDKPDLIAPAIAPGKNSTTEPSNPTALAKAGDTTPALTSEHTEAALAKALTDDRLLQLAREGRLVLRVHSTDTRQLPQLEALNSLSNGRTWKLSKSVPDQVLAAVLPPSQPSSALTEPMQPMLAFTAPFISSAAFASIPSNPDPIPSFRRAYLVDLLDSQRTLSSVKASFTNRLKATLTFEELEHPLDLAKSPDPDSVLWWTQPPSQWTQRLTIPVIVD